LEIRQIRVANRFNSRSRPVAKFNLDVAREIVPDEEKKTLSPFSKQSDTRCRAEALLLLLLRLPAGEDHSGVAVCGFRSRRVPAAGTDSLQRFRFQLRGLSESAVGLRS